MKKLYDLNPLVQFEKCANPHVRCNNHVLPVLVSGIYYEHAGGWYVENNLNLYPPGGLVTALQGDYYV